MLLTRDLAGGLASIVIGAVYLYFAYHLRVSALDDSMGPGGVPRIYGWLLVALGLVLTVQALVSSSRSRFAGAPAKGEWDGQGRKIAWAAGLLLIGIVYLFVVETLGYLISIALLLLVAASYLGGRPGLRLLAIGVGGAVLLWTLFVVVLGVSMPAGLLAAVGL